MERVRFLHIPKTAGSTFNQVLCREYDAARRFAFTGNIENDIKRFNLLTKEEKQIINLFTGHAPISTGIIEADSAKIITFLREPVSRVKSFCQHVYEGKSSHLLKSYPTNNFSLTKLLESGNEELSNLQTKMLINSKSCESNEQLKGMSHAEAIELALENLSSKIYSFGLQEYFLDSIQIFYNVLNWSKIPIFYSVNKKRKKDRLSFSIEQIEKIKELNRLDIELYDQASKIFFKVKNKYVNNTALHKKINLANLLISPALKNWNSSKKQIHNIRNSVKMVFHL